MGNAKLISAAPGAPIGILLVVGILALVLTACLIVVIILRHRMVASEHHTSNNDTERGSILEKNAKSSPKPPSKMHHQKIKRQPLVAEPLVEGQQSFFEDRHSGGGLEAQSFVAGRQSFNGGGGFDAESFAEGRQSFVEGQPVANSRPTRDSWAYREDNPDNSAAMYHELDKDPRSRSFVGEEVTYFM